MASAAGWQGGESMAGTTVAERLEFTPGMLGESLAALAVSKPGDGSLVDIIAAERDHVRDALYKHGALLFRGFGVADPAAFEAVTRAFTPQAFSYVGGSTPRSRIAGEVFTSTEYAADAVLPMHNEASYFKTLPDFVWFCCKVAPEVAGETPLGDMRRVLKRLDPALVKRFDALGLLYVNNLHSGDGFGKSWQQTYQTDDRAEVERRVLDKGLEFEWTTPTNLRVRMRAPVLRTHSVTGDVYWGNQIANCHPALLPETTVRALRRLHGSAINFPKAVVFGDGSEIPDDEVRQVVDALTAEETIFRWQVGDVLLVDNQATAHGRRPFKGARQIMVALA
jgi:alpha-ketoglutarate-dependent taurine dioxygenase